MSAKRVAVVCASADRSNFGNKAVRALHDAGRIVFPIHPVLKRVEGLHAYPKLDALPVTALGRVRFHVSTAIGVGLLEESQRKTVGELWFNPASESPEIVARAESSAST